MADAVTVPVADGRGSLRLLQLTAFVSTLDRFAMPPMLLAIAADLRVPLGQVAAVASAYYLAYGLMQPVWGVVSDRVGVVRVIRWSLLAAAGATALSALAPSTGWLALGRGLAGACFSAAIPSTLVYVGDTVPSHRRQRKVTDLMVGVALGTTVATAGAGAVGSLASWRWAFLATGLLAAVLVLRLGRLHVPETGRAGHKTWRLFGTALGSGPARLVLALAFVEGMVLLGALTYLPPAVEATGSSATVAGAVTALYGVSVLLSARVVGRLAPRVPAHRLVAAGGLAAVAAVAIAAVSTRPLVAVPVSLLLGAAWAGMHSTLQTWATEVVPAARATVVSLFAGALFAGSAAGAALLAAPVQQGRYQVAFLLTLVGAVPLGLAATVGRARWRAPAGPTP